MNIVTKKDICDLKNLYYLTYFVNYYRDAEHNKRYILHPFFISHIQLQKETQVQHLEVDYNEPEISESKASGTLV